MREIGPSSVRGIKGVEKILGGIEMLIFEIILTVIAWRRGWGARALIPMGVVFGVGALIGVGVAVSGGTPEDVTAITTAPLAILFEFAWFVALICLAIARPRRPVVAAAAPGLEQFGAPVVAGESS
jgi:hypothetical protein